jgi:folate-dependent phosphoribosylglycinamide formyltransferase PurN
MDPIRVAVLTSGHFPGADSLIADPNRGVTWELSVVVGSETSLAEAPLLERAGVPFELRPMTVHQRSRGSSIRNLREREDYDDAAGELLQRGRVDVVLLSGYRYIVTEPLLARFPLKIIGIHDADLTLRQAGKLYAGPRAVSDAIYGGERETRTSMYLVTRDVGRGPLLLIGPPFPLARMALDARERGDAVFLDRYAPLHRSWMVESCWGPMMVRALELLAAGSIRVIGESVWIDGAPAPCRFGESPAACHDPEEMVVRGIPRSCPFIG